MTNAHIFPLVLALIIGMIAHVYLRLIYKLWRTASDLDISQLKELRVKIWLIVSWLFFVPYSILQYLSSPDIGLIEIGLFSQTWCKLPQKQDSSKIE